MKTEVKYALVVGALTGIGVYAFRTRPFHDVDDVTYAGDNGLTRSASCGLFSTLFDFTVSATEQKRISEACQVSYAKDRNETLVATTGASLLAAGAFYLVSSKFLHA